MPSSPIGPWISGRTTTCSSAVAGRTVGSGSIAGPSTCSGSAGSASGPSASILAALSESIHSPVRVMPTGTSSYRSGSAARSTWLADTQDTSCSADTPPKRTTSRIRGLGIPPRVGPRTPVARVTPPRRVLQMSGSTPDAMRPSCAHAARSGGTSDRTRSW